MGTYDFSAGKLDYDLLRQLIADLPLSERVVVGPKIGEDAAVIDVGDRYLVVSTDPITFATDLIGWYAVHVNANDVATMGAKPLWFLATILLPEGQTDERLVNEIFDQMKEACNSLCVEIVGGHAEITPELTRPIVIGTMLGEVEKDKLVTSSGAQVGDLVLATKGVPIEGTAIIAREKESELKSKGVPEKVIERAKQFLFEPSISVVRDALIACSVAKVNAMHDPTEGGLAMGLWELAEASQVTIEVEMENLPIVPEGQKLCQAFGLNPLGTISSGTLLICLSESEAEKVMKALENEGIFVAPIGQVVLKGEISVIARYANGRKAIFPKFPKDEIVKLFG
ncbi:MAG: AIR synthase family protein [Armatimonadetes bacterium]|nr:AIR synthase family protein [Armatimonadota bacterium]